MNHLHRKEVLILSAFIIFAMVSSGSVNALTAPWWNPAYQYRNAITLSNSNSATLSNYTETLNVSYHKGMQTNFGDLRFVYYNPISGINTLLGSTDNSPSAILPNPSSQFLAGNYSTEIVKIPELKAGENTIIYMYYGNSYVTSIANSSQAYLFYDNFDSGTASSIGANVLSTGNAIATLSSGQLEQSGGTAWWGVSSHTTIFLPLDISYLITFTANHPTAYSAGSYNPSIFLINTTGVTFGTDYANPTNNEVGLLSSSITFSSTTAQIIIDSVNSTSVTYSSQTLTGSGFNTNTSKTTKAITGSINSLAIDFNSGNYENYPTWWDNITIQQYAPIIPTYTFGAQDYGNPPGGTYILLTSQITHCCISHSTREKGQ